VDLGGARSAPPNDGKFTVFITLKMCFEPLVCKLASTRYHTVLATAAIQNIHCALVCFLIPYDLPQRFFFLTVLSVAIFY
jgi:hypothetical protein